MPERPQGREANGKFGPGNRAARKPRTVAETFAQVFGETMKASKAAAKKAASAPRRARDDDD
jgi:hypothetical protein